MNELIKVDQDNLISARELHEFLESKQDFTTWIKSKIERYGFVENEDFTFHKFMEGKSWKHDYAITIDVAKELSMVENNEKGRQARRYFIQCEKSLKNNMKVLSPSEQLELHYKVIKEQENKIDSIDRKVDNLENNLPLFSGECKDLQSVVKKVATKTLGGYRSAAYIDNSIRGKVYTDIQQQLRREFGVDRYEHIKRCQLEVAKQIVKEYKAPLVLMEQIELVNSQVAI